MIKLLEKESNTGVLNNLVLTLAQIQYPAMIKPMVEALGPKDKQVIGMAIDAIDNLPSTEVRLDMKKGLRSIL